MGIINIFGRISLPRKLKNHQNFAKAPQSAKLAKKQDWRENRWFSKEKALFVKLILNNLAKTSDVSIISVAEKAC